MIRKTSIICLEVILGIAVVLGILGAVSAWRLSQGPVSIKFLLPYAEDVLRRADSPVHADLEDLRLAWAGWERALDLRAVNVRVYTADTEHQLVRVREVSVTLSMRALVDGRITPTSLEVIQPLIRLSRQEDGSFRFGMSDRGGPVAGTEEDFLTPLLEEFSRPSDTEGRLGYLRQVSVLGAMLRVKDRSLGINWGAQDVDLTLERASLGLRATFDLTADLESSHPELDGEVLYHRNQKHIDIAANFRKLSPHSISKRYEDLAFLSVLNAEFSGEIQTRIDLEGEISSASFELASSAGSLEIPNIDTPPFSIKKVELEGRLNRYPDEVQISRLIVDLDKARAEIKGVVTRVGEIVEMNATFESPKLPVDAVGKFWSPSAGGSAREWVVTNIRGGMITDANASLTARIGLEGQNRGKISVDSINGRFDIDGTTVDYLSPMPKITEAAATATFSNKRLDFAVRKGRIGELGIKEGVVNITQIGADQEMLGISTLVQGPVKPTLDLVAHPRLDLLRRVGLKMREVEGTHSTRLQINLPLLAGLKASDVVVSATSNIRGLAIPDLLKGKGIRKGHVKLVVNNDTLTVSGDTEFSETPIDFKWIEDFSGRRETRRRLEAEFTSNARLAGMFGLHHPEIIYGPVPLKVIYQDLSDSIATLSADMNLQKAKLSIPGFQWAKPLGRPGTATVAATLRNNVITEINGFRVDAGALAIAGKVEYGAPDGKADPRIAAIHLDQFKLGSTEFAAIIKRDPDGEYAIAVKGTGFDASPFDLQGMDTFTLPALRLNGTFEKFWIGRGAPANNVNMKLRYDGAHWQYIDVVGALPDGGKAIEIRLHPKSGGHKMALYSADAGVFLNALGITNTIVGGSIEVAGFRRGQSDTPWIGTAAMKRFRVAKAPNFARLMTIASLTGISDLVAGNGVQFRRVQFPFIFANDVVTIKDAQAVGSELGITASGRIDFRNDEIDITGTIVPAYTINSALGKIPVIGQIFSGKKGGGIFAASYKVSGAADKPVMSVNPLSVLAPGFLRNLVDGAEGINEGMTPTDEESLGETKPKNQPPTQ